MDLASDAMSNCMRSLASTLTTGSTPRGVRPLCTLVYARTGRVSVMVSSQTVGVTPERRAKVARMIDLAIASRVMSPADASSLRGKARFCLSPVFGRVGVALLQLLRKRQHEDSSSEVDCELEEVLLLLKAAVGLLPAFAVRFRKDVRPCLVILTDASFETSHTWLGFFVCCPLCGVRWAGCSTPKWLLRMLARHKQRDTYIGQLEMVVADAPYISLPEAWLRDRAVMHYVDNQGALYALIHGRAVDADMNRMAPSLPFLVMWRGAT